LSPKRVAIRIQNATACKSVPPAARLRAWARAAAADAPAGEITLRVVDERESADLNRRYRRRDGPTNVLAFPADAVLPAGAAQSLPLGDIVVCAPVVAREAAEQHKSEEAHWAHIVIHGCLHLIGYDHQNEAQAVPMEAKERELLAHFGFPDPY
jgi:probable rRNA maturation factor